MTDRDKAWAVSHLIRAIRDGRCAQAYALARALAHYCGKS